MANKDMPIYLEARERNPFTGTMVLMTVDHYKELLVSASPQSPPAEPAAVAAMEMLQTASHALRSYQYGNCSSDLAADVADRIDAIVAALPMPGVSPAQDPGRSKGRRRK